MYCIEWQLQRQIKKNLITKFSAHSMGSAKSILGADETMANSRISDKNREQILMHENKITN